MPITNSTDTIIIGVAGADHKSGCTHTCLVLANFLKNKGYNVALLEENKTRVFHEIMDAEELQMDVNSSFYLNGIDFYLYRKPRPIPLIMSRPYHFLIIDYGKYADCDQDFFCSNTIKIITSGSKPWEFNGINEIFAQTSDEILKSFHFCFSFANNNRPLQKEILEAMDELEHVYFPPYTENPFTEDNFPDAYSILGNRITTNIEENTDSIKKKIRLFGGIKKDNKKKEKIVIPTVEEKEAPSFEAEFVSAKPEEEKSEEKIKEIEETDTSLSKSKDNFFSKFTSSKKEKEKEEPIIFVLDEPEANISTNIAGIAPMVTDILFDIEELKNEIQEAEVNDSELMNLELLEAYKYAFCLALRSGYLAARKNGQDGAAVLSVLFNGREMCAREDDLRKILGESADNIIRPYEDTYRKVGI